MAALTRWVNGGSLAALNWQEVQHGFSDPVGKRRNYGCFQQAVNWQEPGAAGKCREYGYFELVDKWQDLGCSMVNGGSISMAAQNRHG